MNIKIERVRLRSMQVLIYRRRTLEIAVVRLSIKVAAA